MPRGFRHLLRSYRIRPIEPFSSSCSRLAGSASSRAGRCSRPTSSTSPAACPPAASADCWAWCLPPTMRRAAGSSSTSRTRAAIRSWRGSRARPTRSSPTPGRGSTCSSTSRGALSSNRFRITTADISRSVPTGTFTSVSATADRGTIRITARKTRTSCSARCCAST